MRIKLVLSYNGSGFCGWQIQPSDPSVQGEIEKALSTVLSEQTSVTGAGRTDTDVNASYYVAHFDTTKTISDAPDAFISPKQLCRSLNAILPKGIAIRSAEAVSDDFHARFSAKSRQYTYYIHNYKDPFIEDFSWRCLYNLDIEKMNRACALLLGEHDFGCFEKKGSDNATSLCNITSAVWTEEVNSCGRRLKFTISANRFLRNMVRAIVGTMVDIGRGVHEPEYILELIESSDRCKAGQSVPGHALFLSDIKY